MTAEKLHPDQPYVVGDKCEWLHIESGYWPDGAPQAWQEAEIVKINPDTGGWAVLMRTGLTFRPWTRWIWVDWDGNGWDNFPDYDVRPDEVAQVCRHRLRRKPS